MQFCLPHIFLPVSVCHTDLGWGGGGAVAIAASPHSKPHPPHTLIISLCRPHLSRPWEDLPTDLWAIQPTSREVRDFKKAVSVKVKETVSQHLDKHTEHELLWKMYNSKDLKQSPQRSFLSYCKDFLESLQNVTTLT
jgi:hypothetical protein